MPRNLIVIPRATRVPSAQCRASYTRDIALLAELVGELVVAEHIPALPVVVPTRHVVAPFARQRIWGAVIRRGVHHLRVRGVNVVVGVSPCGALPCRATTAPPRNAAESKAFRGASDHELRPQECVRRTPRVVRARRVARRCQEHPQRPAGSFSRCQEHRQRLVESFSRCQEHPQQPAGSFSRCQEHLQRPAESFSCCQEHPRRPARYFAPRQGVRDSHNGLFSRHFAR